MSASSLACLILAGGKGTRMKSSLPKLLHRACGRSLLEWSLAAVEPLGARPSVVVLPPDSPEMEAMLPEWVTMAVQHTPRGTGDAVLAARDVLAGFR
ncbi:MAG: NTP transferase domain-containing protein, partial [Gaiellales bacterium]